MATQVRRSAVLQYPERWRTFRQQQSLIHGVWAPQQQKRIAAGQAARTALTLARPAVGCRTGVYVRLLESRACGNRSQLQGAAGRARVAAAAPWSRGGGLLRRLRLCVQCS